VATKTLSVDEDAYLRLMSAKLDRRESFSAVIKRAHWDTGAKRCGDLLARASGHVSAEILDKLDQAQATDAPPTDKWNI
jgi:predicted CopG family antitoxin